MNEQLLVKKLNDRALMPVRGSEHAAGLDVHACLPEGEVLIIPGVAQALRAAETDRIGNVLKSGDALPDESFRLIKTGLSMRCPAGTYVRIAPRSGLAYKNGIDVLAGVIDVDYTGEVGVILANYSTKPFEVRHGDRIAQLIMERISMADPVEVDELPDTVRSSAGWGSTGVAAKQ
jgi:dUTP pyrophosphatase